MLLGVAETEGMGGAPQSLSLALLIGLGLLIEENRLYLIGESSAEHVTPAKNIFLSLCRRRKSKDFAMKLLKI